MLFLRWFFFVIFLLASLVAGAVAYNFLFLFEKEVIVGSFGMDINSGYIASGISVVFYVTALFLLPWGKLRKK